MGGSLSGPAGTHARMPRHYIPDPTKRQVTTTGRETQVLNGPGTVTWPGLLGARPTRSMAHPRRCWERRTIDIGKASPTLAALQRQIAHRG